jgi:hypothetical protein
MKSRPKIPRLIFATFEKSAAPGFTSPARLAVLCKQYMPARLRRQAGIDAEAVTKYYSL